MGEDSEISDKQVELFIEEYNEVRHQKTSAK